MSTAPSTSEKKTTLIILVLCLTQHWAGVTTLDLWLKSIEEVPKDDHQASAFSDSSNVSGYAM